MKRLSIRLSIIGVLIASGILAIAQAQRGANGEGDHPTVAGDMGAGGSTGAGGTVSPSDQPAPQPQPLLDNTALAPMGVTPGYGPDPTPQEDFSGGPPRATTQAQALADVTGPPANTLSAPPLNEMPLPPTGPSDSASAGASLSDLPPTAPSAGASLSDLPPTGMAEVVQPMASDLPPTDLPPSDLPPGGALADLPPTGLAPGGLAATDLPPTDLPATDLPPTDLPATDLPPTGLPAGSEEYTAGVEGNLAPITPTPAPITPAPISPADPNGIAAAPITPAPNDVPTPADNLAGGLPSAAYPDGPAPYGSPYGQPSDNAASASLADGSVGEPNGLSGTSGLGGPLAAGAAGAELGSQVAPSIAPMGDSVGAIGAVAPASAAEPSVAVEPAPIPGERVLEGQQTPFVAIEKRAPREIRVGQPATFEIIVRNAGQVTAQDVTVIDQVPRGTQFMDATPAPQQLPNGALVWSFGAVAPGQDKVVTLRLMPQQEGEIGSVAKVICQSQASVRTNCTRPELAIRQTAPEQVLIGDEVEVLIEISNPGTGAADDVVLEADIPPGLLHRKGREIDYTIGTLQPNESRTVRLQLAADQAGVVSQSIRARAGNLEKKSSVAIEVVAPDLQMKIFGPAKRYIRREAAFELELANPGTATARDIQAVVYLPQGLEFKNASHQGRYNPQNHAVFWRLEELPKGQSGKVQLTALPVAPGEQSLRAEGRGNLNTASNTEHTLAVESLNELVFTVSDVNDPIEVGSETVYEIRVTNNGSKTDTNVEVVAQLPEGMQLQKADGPTDHQAEGAVVAFTPLARLAPNGDAVYRLAVKGAAEGDHRLRVQIRSTESPTAVIKEEVTRVYKDR